MSSSNVLKFIAILSTVFLSGCVGLGAGYLGNDEHILKNPHIQLEKGSVSSIEGAVPWITSEVLQRYWGLPESVKHISQNKEQWQYNFGRRWNGIGLLVAFVPLPLMIPVGDEYIRFTIENGKVVKATTNEDDWIVMYGCAAIAFPHAQGADCTFGRQQNVTRFITDSQPLKVLITNAMSDEVLIVYSYAAGTPPLTLEPHESRSFLRSHFVSILIKDKDGNNIADLWKPASTYISDSTIFYLVAKNHVFPIPPKYWDNWEDHINDFTKIEDQRDQAGKRGRSD